MNLFRYQPFAVSGWFSTGAYFTPAVDVTEEDERYVLRADLPGVDPKDLEIVAENDVLIVKGERVAEERSEEENHTRVERTSGQFERRFRLPETADTDAISASGKHGVLEIVIPKRPQAKPRRIAISAV